MHLSAELAHARIADMVRQGEEARRARAARGWTKQARKRRRMDRPRVITLPETASLTPGGAERVVIDLVTAAPAGAAVLPASR
jgi:hypothetical protein